VASSGKRKKNEQRARRRAFRLIPDTPERHSVRMVTECEVVIEEEADFVEQRIRQPKRRGADFLHCEGVGGIIKRVIQQAVAIGKMRRRESRPRAGSGPLKRRTTISIMTA